MDVDCGAIRTASPTFHEVDFPLRRFAEVWSALRPLRLPAVGTSGLGRSRDAGRAEGTQKPDRRPGTLTLGHFGHDLEAPISPGCSVAGVYASRGVSMKLIVDGGRQKALGRLFP